MNNAPVGQPARAVSIKSQCFQFTKIKYGFNGSKFRFRLQISRDYSENFKQVVYRRFMEVSDPSLGPAFARRTRAVWAWGCGVGVYARDIATVNPEIVYFAPCEY